MSCRQFNADLAEYHSGLTVMDAQLAGTDAALSFMISLTACSPSFSLCQNEAYAVSRCAVDRMSASALSFYDINLCKRAALAVLTELALAATAP